MPSAGPVRSLIRVMRPLSRGDGHLLVRPSALIASHKLASRLSGGTEKRGKASPCASMTATRHRSARGTCSAMSWFRFSPLSPAHVQSPWLRQSTAGSADRLKARARSGACPARFRLSISISACQEFGRRVRNSKPGTLPSQSQWPALEPVSATAIPVFMSGRPAAASVVFKYHSSWCRKREPGGI